MNNDISVSPNGVSGAYFGLPLSSRELTLMRGLNQEFANRLAAMLVDLRQRGFRYDIDVGHRDHPRQLELYLQGRDTPGKIVTKAPPGYSYHEYDRAVDLMPRVNNKRDERSKIAWDHFYALRDNAPKYQLKSGASYQDWYHIEDGMYTTSQLRKLYPLIAKGGDALFAEYNATKNIALSKPVVVSQPIGTSVSAPPVLQDRVPNVSKNNPVPTDRTQGKFKPPQPIATKPLTPFQQGLFAPPQEETNYDDDFSDGFNPLTDSVYRTIKSFLRDRLTRKDV